MSDKGKHFHEIRDPIHVFVRLSSDERKLVDSLPFQRLRYIHQLATTYLVYPGATHRRFEHSLGVMELASRVFDVITQQNHIHADVVKALPEITNSEKLVYWKKALRLAALCHDLGHLPFSHAAENELLPPHWTHERLSEQIIKSNYVSPLLSDMVPPVSADHVVKLALGPKEAIPLGYKFTLWETVLSEIIVGNAFGVDRMDYLLRDSHHAGVVYGHFDHYRVIDCLRVLLSPVVDAGQGVHEQPPALGITEGGLHSADAMLLARYFMFSQLYFHPVRRIYDIHLKDFLLQEIVKFSTNVNDLLKVSDNEIVALLSKAAADATVKGHDPARRLIYHQHFQLVYRRREEDVALNPEAALRVYEAVSVKFGADNFRYDKPSTGTGTKEFPVLLDNDDVKSSLSVSETLPKVPPIAVEYVFADRKLVDEVRRWIDQNRSDIISKKPADEEDDPKEGAK